MVSEGMAQVVARNCLLCLPFILAVREEAERKGEGAAGDSAAVEISSNDYEPSEKDIIYAEGVTQSNGLVSVEFSVDDRTPISIFYDENVQCPPLTKYQLVRTNSNWLKSGCKWLEMFEDVRAVIFCVALSDYDVMEVAHFTDSMCNKMLASRDMFETLVQHPSFRDIPFLLLLNKYDAFEQKISQVPLNVCKWFEDFCPAKLHCNNQSLAHQAYYYVAVKFKQLYASITGQKLYVCQTRALERTSVDEALKFVQEVLKWDEVRDEFLYGLMADDSFDSTDVTSYEKQD
ncbi:Extra-large guanine nucleotide-binding protein 3 [Bienertia sinuspersici]